MTRKIAIILTIVLVSSFSLNTNLLLADNQQAEKFYQKGEEYYEIGFNDRSLLYLKKAQKYFNHCAKINPDYKHVKFYLRSLKDLIKRTIVGQAQDKLRELGYEPERTDGSWNKAIKKFQQQNDLSITGKLDEETIEKLQIEMKTLPKRPLPHSIDEAKSQHDIKVKAGDRSDFIIRVYGKPSSDHILKGYDPPVMRSIVYKHLGLTFLFNRERLCRIDITKEFHGEVFSLRIGDPISRAIAIYGDDYNTLGFEVRKTATHTYQWKTRLPNWLIYTKDDIIVKFTLHDASIYGNWLPKM